MTEQEDRQKKINRATAAGVIAGFVLAPFTGGASLIGSAAAGFMGAAATAGNNSSKSDTSCKDD